MAIDVLTCAINHVFFDWFQYRFWFNIKYLFKTLNMCSVKHLCKPGFRQRVFFLHISSAVTKTRANCMFKANKTARPYSSQRIQSIVHSERMCANCLIPSCGNLKIALFLTNIPFCRRFLQCLPFYYFFYSAEFSAMADKWFIVRTFCDQFDVVACESCEQTVNNVVSTLVHTLNKW